MKKFAFALDAVLKLRARAENEAQLSHSAASRRLEKLILELAENEEELKTQSAQLARMQEASFRPAQRDMLWNALNYQKDFCERIAQKIEFAAKDAEEKREALLKAKMEHEALVKLKEKQKTEHSQLAEQEERAMIDDIVTARHAANVWQRESEAA